MKKTNRLDISPYTPFDDIQALVRPISMPWTSLLDGLSDSIYPLGVDDLSDALKNYSSLAELYRVPDYLASSALLRFNFEDNVLASETPSESDFTRGDGSASPSGDTTSAFDVNKTNQEYLDYLRTRTEEVTYAIAHTAFEDVKASADSAASQVTGINPDSYDQYGSNTMGQYEDFAGFAFVKTGNRHYFLHHADSRDLVHFHPSFRYPL